MNNEAYYEKALETIAARMMQLLTEFGPPDERWDPADAHEEVRESHPEMAAALRRLEANGGYDRGWTLNRQ